MEKKRLGEIMTFSLGKNPTRIKEVGINMYLPEDFEQDLYSISQHDSDSECIINLIKSKVAPISLGNKNKCITSNFLKCKFDERVLDKWYFCYQFNEGKEFEQQIAMYHQGTTTSVKKLNVKIVGELSIKLPDMRKQHKIGELYQQFLMHNYLMMKQVDDIRRLTLTMIRKIEED